MKYVWYVAGADGDDTIRAVLFSTKLAAEMYARLKFPDESPDARYARIFYRSVWEEDDLK